eukprot:TRINITY_DN97776_c0_g1_i1.p1 TRINITY_DN97776_c0_g1~~TRINITY_DN97776_c0_g1_i1.p1  ORF type:complete len:182 (+),score=37.76 TRINITY_DN97776_c0_g1_i1:83-628(+)
MALPLQAVLFTLFMTVAAAGSPLALEVDSSGYAQAALVQEGSSQAVRGVEVVDCRVDKTYDYQIRVAHSLIGVLEATCNQTKVRCENGFCPTKFNLETKACERNPEQECGHDCTSLTAVSLCAALPRATCEGSCHTGQPGEACTSPCKWDNKDEACYPTQDTALFEEDARDAARYCIGHTY